MSDTFEVVRGLISESAVVFSIHSLRELDADRISITECLDRMAIWSLIEDYPDYHKGPCVLVLGSDGAGQPVHMLWGMAKGTDGPAVLITSYRPDPRKWSDDFRTRRAR